jgi:hypothetical protein
MLPAVIARERILRPKQSPRCQRSLRGSVLCDRSKLHAASGHCEEAYFATEAISTLPAVIARERTCDRSKAPCCQRSLRGSVLRDRSNLHVASGHCEGAYFPTEANSMLPAVIARERTLRPKQSPRCQRSLRGSALCDRSNLHVASGHCYRAYFATEAISMLPAVIARSAIKRKTAFEAKMTSS